MIINMWSGPRTLSTALMRSFENRNDTSVWDEPMYAYYLNKTKLNHPMAKQIIKTYETNIDLLIKDMTKDYKNKIFYLKHMSHHLLRETPMEWINSGKNCFLIRDPKKVIISYSKNNIIKDSDDIGFPTQLKIFKYLKKNKQQLIVINSDDLASNPKKTLIGLCKKLNIVFNVNMLKWPKGVRKSDGIWGKVWYKNVINSDSFEKKEVKSEPITDKYKKILFECNQIYEELNYYNLLKD